MQLLCQTKELSQPLCLPLIRGIIDFREAFLKPPLVAPFNHCGGFRPGLGPHHAGPEFSPLNDWIKQKPDGRGSIADRP